MEAFTTLIGQYNAVALSLLDGEFSTLALDSASRAIIDHSSSSIKIGDGTDILDVLEWDAASSGDEKGLLPFGIYKANPTNLADTDGDFVPFQFDSNGRLRVDAEVSVETGSDKEEDEAHSSGDIGAYILSVRVDDIDGSNSAFLAGTEGDYQSFLTNAKGELYVTDKDVASLLTTIDSVLDNILTDTNAMVVDLAAIEAELLAQGLTLDNIETSIDNIEADIDSIVHEEDSGHTTGDKGVMSLGVVNENGDDLADTEKDYVPIATNKKGHIYTVEAEVEGEEGTEVDVGVDEANDGEVDVAYHTSNFTEVLSVAVGAGETLYIKGWELNSDWQIAGRICIYDDTTLTKVIRKANTVESKPSIYRDYGRAIEVTGGANITVKLEARCMRKSKTAHVGGGINAYKR